MKKCLCKHEDHLRDKYSTTSIDSEVSVTSQGAQTPKTFIVNTSSRLRRSLSRMCSICSNKRSKCSSSRKSVSHQKSSSYSTTKSIPSRSDFHECRCLPEKSETRSRSTSPVRSRNVSSGIQTGKRDSILDAVLQKIPGGAPAQRYHGPGCAVELDIYAKHDKACQARRGDLENSYETIGRIVYKLCAKDLKKKLNLKSIDLVEEEIADVRGDYNLYSKPPGQQPLTRSASDTGAAMLKTRGSFCEIPEGALKSRKRICGTRKSLSHNDLPTKCKPCGRTYDPHFEKKQVEPARMRDVPTNVVPCPRTQSVACGSYALAAEDEMSIKSTKVCSQPPSLGVEEEIVTTKVALGVQSQTMNRAMDKVEVVSILPGQTKAAKCFVDLEELFPGKGGQMKEMVDGNTEILNPEAVGQLILQMYKKGDLHSKSHVSISIPSNLKKAMQSSTVDKSKLQASSLFY